MGLCMFGHCHKGVPLCLCPTYWTTPQAKIKTVMSRSVWVCCWRSFRRPCSTNMKWWKCHDFTHQFIHSLTLAILDHELTCLCSFLQQDSAKCVFLLHGHITAVKSLSFCCSGLALVSGGIGGLLNLWSLQVWKQYLLLLPLSNLNLVQRSLT